MAIEFERLEVYLDGSPQPLRVLSKPPYDLQLDTGTLADGEHQLRVLAVYRSGARKERIIPFTVESLPALSVRGLSRGQAVQGALQLSFDAGGGEVPRAGRRGHRWLYAASAVVVLGGVWVLFALLSPVGNILGPVVAKGAAGVDGGRVAASGADMHQGQEIYSQHCASCHGTKGEGAPGAFPPMAGNSNLEDPSEVVQTIHHGLSGPISVKGQHYSGEMPAFSQLTPPQLAAVATYVRNSFGNGFGGVSEQQAVRFISGGGLSKSPIDPKLLSDGKALYLNRCEVCHQENGSGIPGARLPPLAENPHLKSVELIAHAIHGGQAGPILVNGTEYNGQMPPMPDLSAEQVAALATYVRNSFGNAFGGAPVEQVRRALLPPDAGESLDPPR